MEYEKTFYPFILFSKKRYLGNKYEFSTEKYKLSSMGIVLKRRDNAPILKYIYADVIDAILNKRDIPLSIDRLQKNLQKLVRGEFPLEYLIITKSLRSHYDNPDQIVHKALADRIGERDPGNRPEANDRIPYIYFDVGNRQISLQGDRVEHPDFIRQNGLRPDYVFYITNQIMKPISQIYGLILEDLRGYKYARDHFERLASNMRREGHAEDKVRKKMDDMRVKEVIQLLFEPILRRERNRREGNQDISRWFSRSTLKT